MKNVFDWISRVGLLSVACLLASGCGTGSEAVAPPSGGIKSLIKANLENPMKTGQIGSESMAIGMDIDKLEAEDSALAAELKKDLADLQKASSPSAVKAKAKAMSDKL